MSVAQFADIFYGNFEPELPEPDEVASKWFFLKAQVGNTTPAAATPFGMMSACAYTGGYPTGYSPYLPNSYARPSTFIDKDNITALGFSHFHQSGTGDIGVFYNFSIITPVNGTSHTRFDRYALTNERGEAGYYACRLGEVDCEVTVSKKAAIYRFKFNNDGENTVYFDPLLHGLFKDEVTPSKPLGELLSIERAGALAKTLVSFCDGLVVHSVVMCDEADFSQTASDGAVAFVVNGDTATVRVAISFSNAEKAEKKLGEIAETDFDEVRANAFSLWENALSRVEIDAESKEKTKFYSNLYRSLIKPVDMGDDNGFGVEGECFADLATLWDMSKTQLPLVFTLFDEIGGRIVNSFISSFKRYGLFPNSYLMNGCDVTSDHQARALTMNSIYDAYLRGVSGVDWHEALALCVAELERDYNKSFFDGKAVSEYASHTIDLAIASYSTARLAEALGEKEIAEKFSKFSDAWQSAYDKKTGILYENGKFYEGCNLNYTFRLLPDMQKRVEIAGGRGKFEQSLDSFFGFDKEPAVQILNRLDAVTYKNGADRRGFEGFNNETDMETPYCYSFIGRSDKANMIVRSGERSMYGESGKGALCGNEDSGALSSLFVCNALGIFPCFGQDRVIIGHPLYKNAKITLANGNKLEIICDCHDSEKNAVEKITFNGRELTEPFITVTELMGGGKLAMLATRNVIM